MPKIKNWDKMKDSKYTMQWRNENAPLKKATFQDLVAEKRRDDKWYLVKRNMNNIRDKQSESDLGRFITKEEAREEAVRYMKENPTPSY